MAEDSIISGKVGEHPLHAVAGECIVTIGDKNVTTHTGFERANCVLQMIPRSVRVLTHVYRRDAQVLGDEIGRQIILVRSGWEMAVADKAIHIVFVQPGILDGIGRRFQMGAEGCSSGDTSLRRVTHADDRILVFKW